MIDYMHLWLHTTGMVRQQSKQPELLRHAGRKLHFLFGLLHLAPLSLFPGRPFLKYLGPKRKHEPLPHDSKSDVLFSLLTGFYSLLLFQNTHEIFLDGIKVASFRMGLGLAYQQDGSHRPVIQMWQVFQKYVIKGGMYFLGGRRCYSVNFYTELARMQFSTPKSWAGRKKGLQPCSWPVPFHFNICLGYSENPRAHTGLDQIQEACS